MKWQRRAKGLRPGQVEGVFPHVQVGLGQAAQPVYRILDTVLGGESAPCRSKPMRFLPWIAGNSAPRNTALGAPRLASGHKGSWRTLAGAVLRFSFLLHLLAELHEMASQPGGRCLDVSGRFCAYLPPLPLALPVSPLSTRNHHCSRARSCAHAQASAGPAPVPAGRVLAPRVRAPGPPRSAAGLALGYASAPAPAPGPPRSVAGRALGCAPAPAPAPPHAPGPPRLLLVGVLSPYPLVDSRSFSSAVIASHIPR